MVFLCELCVLSVRSVVKIFWLPAHTHIKTAVIENGDETISISVSVTMTFINVNDY